MTDDERDGLLNNLRRYLSANLELDTPVGKLVNERISQFIDEHSDDASEAEILELTDLMRDHKRLVNAFHAPSIDTSELSSDDIPPP